MFVLFRCYWRPLLPLLSQAIGSVGLCSKNRVLCSQASPSNPVALPDLYFHSSVRPVASFVIRARGIVSVVSSIVSFSNHKPRLASL